MRRTPAERAQAFLVSLSKPVIVLFMTFMTFAAAYPILVAISAAGGDLKEPSLINEMPFVVRVFFGVILVPPLETAVAQWAPIMLCMRRFGMSATASGLISAILFGLGHSFSAAYMLATFVVGLLFSYTFFLAIARKESPFWMVTAVHATRNAVTLALRTLL